MHFRQCRGFICNKYPTSLSPKSSHTSRQIGILHYSIKVFVGYWDILPYYPSHRRKKAASRWKTNACGSFCVLKIARKMHRVFYRPPKNPHLRGFQWVFTLFLQVLNEWIFTATHRSSHRSLCEHPWTWEHTNVLYRTYLDCLCAFRFAQSPRR